jgi:hypothetical protein
LEPTSAPVGRIAGYYIVYSTTLGHQFNATSHEHCSTDYATDPIYELKAVQQTKAVQTKAVQSKAAQTKAVQSKSNGGRVANGGADRVANGGARKQTRKTRKH